MCKNVYASKEFVYDYIKTKIDNLLESYNIPTTSNHTMYQIT